jgi:hypothetical protein
MSRFRRRVSSGTSAPTSAGEDKSAANAQAASPARRQRHAIFYDVENTSSPDDVEEVVSVLEMDRQGSDTHLVAVGNWRVIGQHTARRLARQGAELVHSAPSTGVRDWSDLRIAVDAGIWLAAARPGDKLHIISDDQAFDAVGDVAATLGVDFRRIAPRQKRAAERAAAAVRAPHTAAAPHHAAAASHPAADAGPQATHRDILEAVKRLTASDSSAGVSLDTLSNALKDRGFRRAPGSFRLITRLRRIKELEVGADGIIRLAPHGAADSNNGPLAGDVAPTATPRKRARRGRRGGRRRSGRQHADKDNGSSHDTTGDTPP